MKIHMLSWHIKTSLTIIITMILISIILFATAVTTFNPLAYVTLLGILIIIFIIDIISQRRFDKKGVYRKASIDSTLHDFFDVSVYDSSIDVRCKAYLLTALTNTLFFIALDLVFISQLNILVIFIDILLSASIFFTYEYFIGER